MTHSQSAPSVPTVKSYGHAPQGPTRRMTDTATPSREDKQMEKLLSWGDKGAIAKMSDEQIGRMSEKNQAIAKDIRNQQQTTQHETNTAKQRENNSWSNANRMDRIDYNAQSRSSSYTASSYNGSGHSSSAASSRPTTPSSGRQTPDLPSLNGPQRPPSPQQTAASRPAEPAASAPQSAKSPEAQEASNAFARAMRLNDKGNNNALVALSQDADKMKHLDPSQKAQIDHAVSAYDSQKKDLTQMRKQDGDVLQISSQGYNKNITTQERFDKAVSAYHQISDPNIKMAPLNSLWLDPKAFNELNPAQQQHLMQIREQHVNQQNYFAAQSSMADVPGKPT